MKLVTTWSLSEYAPQAIDLGIQGIIITDVQHMNIAVTSKRKIKVLNSNWNMTKPRSHNKPTI